MSHDAVGLVWERSPFTVVAAPRKYTTEPPETLTPDTRLQTRLHEHQAWLAADWMLPVRTEDQKAIAYRTLGVVISLYCGDDVLLIYEKETGRLVPYREGAAVELMSEEPRKVFASAAVPIVQVANSSDLDQKLAAAGEEARARLPEFVSALGRRRPGQMFTIKTDFREMIDGEEVVEWMWVEVDRAVGDGFEGTLGNDPESLRSVKLGDRVTVRTDRIADWMYEIEGDPPFAGGFSVKVLAAEDQ
jgi:uncharacterized protein YegJ (DUF2314 family)